MYLCIVAIWFYLEMPIAVMAPMFFADPSGRACLRCKVMPVR